ncbi:MAG TPA: AAA family ATPase [Planctomycetota bacterium]|nr:AAA family ATPase [Planctomycetota bacterium]
MALEEILGAKGRKYSVSGVVARHFGLFPSLAQLARPASSVHYDVGPVQHVDVDIPGGLKLACVKQGLYFIHDGGPMALLISQMDMGIQRLTVEVMAKDRDSGERLLREVMVATRHGKAFRGHVLSIETDCMRNIAIKSHRLPHIDRKDVILPEILLQRIERHTLSFSRHSDQLRAAGRHLKRGILLYGPPGTGKTLSAMYLVSQMQGRTVLLLTGQSLGNIETACRLARILSPATVILEDVDLIGTEREEQTVGANALLFELLNQMDGLAEDIDVLFILTTNRPEILEPALAARPGRIDQAIEIPPPDAECRRRLIELYGRGMTLKLERLDGLIERTEGVSAAFIRELLRKAAVYALEDKPLEPPVITDDRVDEAISELLLAGGALTQSLLGAKSRKAGGN